MEENVIIRGFAKYSLNRDISDHSQSCRYNIDERVVLAGALMESNPVQDFLFDVHADGSVTFCSDYGIMFGQKAIDNMNQTQLRRYMNSLVPRSSNYTRNYNDDFLLDYCKDRNIQSATEMASWLDHLLSEGQSLESDLQAYAASLSASVTESTQPAAQSSSE